jgi:hypothetical protein
MSDDFLRICIDAQVQLAPGLSRGSAVFAHLPLAFPIHFQSRRIDDQMHRLAGQFYRHRYRQATLTTQQRRIGRGVKPFIQPHQGQQRLNKALRLAQGQMEQPTQRQRHFNRLIRVGILSTALHRPRIIPTRQHGIIQPQGQAASGDQRTIIHRPVCDTIDRFFLTEEEAFDTLLITGFWERGGVFLPGNHSPI